MTAAARIKQADIDRTMKAAKRAGFASVRVRFRPDGEVVITANEAPSPEGPTDNPWDEVLQ